SATAPTAAGTYVVTASFAGNMNYTAASNTASITINKATPSLSNLSGPTIIYGTASTALSGKVAAGSLIPTGSVPITLNGVTQQAPIAADGTFTSTFATNALRVTPGSPYTITYNYPGDNNFNGVGPDTTKTLTVQKATLTVTADNKTKVLNAANPPFT